MTNIVLGLLVLAFVSLCLPRGAQARAEIRAGAKAAGWTVIVPGARHLLAQALYLLVEALRLIHHTATFIAQVLALAANQLETADMRGDAT